MTVLFQSNHISKCAHNSFIFSISFLALDIFLCSFIFYIIFLLKDTYTSALILYGCIFVFICFFFTVVGIVPGKKREFRREKCLAKGFRKLIIFPIYPRNMKFDIQGFFIKCTPRLAISPLSF